MEAVGEEDALADHPVEAGGELDFGDGECMAEMEGAVGVRVGEVTEPLWVLFLDLCGGEACEVVLWRGVDLEDALLCPSRLVLLLEFAEFVALAGLCELDGVGRSHGAFTRQTSGTKSTSPE